MKPRVSIFTTISLPEVQEFMTVHSNEQASTLCLQYASKVVFDIAFVAQQMELRQKAKKKTSLFLAPTTILLPKLYEQCTHEEIAKYKSSFIQGDTLLDATAGLGIDSFFIGRNFSSRTCLEADVLHAEILDHNFRIQQFKAQIINTTLEDYLENTSGHFDVIYIDPDRRPDSNRKLVEITQCAPNIEALKSNLIDRATAIWIKLSPMMDLHSIVKSLSPNVSNLLCIAYQNELKEILICLKSGEQQTSYVATNITADDTFTFASDRNDIKPILSHPLKYFFEPNVALIKSKLCMQYSLQNKLKVLYPNGYYFTTDFWVPKLQGRFFEIVKAMPYKKEALNNFILEKGIKKVNISCRNFFWKPEEVKKQFRLSDGGDWYLFCFNNSDKKPMTIWCQKYIPTL